MLLKTLDWLSMILVIIGGLNLGFVGLFNHDYIIDLFANSRPFAHLILFLIGLAALYLIFRISHAVRKITLLR